MSDFRDPISGLPRQASVKERLAVARTKVKNKNRSQRWFPYFPKCWVPWQDLPRRWECVVKDLLDVMIRAGRRERVYQVKVRIAHPDRPHLLERMTLQELPDRLLFPLYDGELIDLYVLAFKNGEDGKPKPLLGGRFDWRDEKWMWSQDPVSVWDPYNDGQATRRWRTKVWTKIGQPLRLIRYRPTQILQDRSIPPERRLQIGVYPYPNLLYQEKYCDTWDYLANRETGRQALRTLSEIDWLQAWAEANLVWDHNRSVFLDRFGDPVPNTYRLPSLHPGRRSWYSVGTETISWPQAVVGIQTGRIPRRAEAMDESHALGRIHYK
jgi:hypothetical protein